MDTYGTGLGEKFAANALEKYYETAVQPLITNDDYEKMISPGGAEKISVLTFGDLTINTYQQGTAMTVENPTESEGEINPDQQKAYYFRIRSLAQFESYVNNANSALIDRATKQLKQGVDTYILGLYADVGSGNRVGTNYTTGTVTITVTTGATVGTGTTFTSAMVGLGIKATGHTKWYRIKTYTNATTIVIENDSDDDTSSYDGGTITGATYTIEATTVLTVTSSTIAGYIDNLAERLDAAEVPKENRWLVVNSKIAALIRQSTTYTPAVESAYRDVVQKGLIGEISGLQVFQNERVAGDNTTGYYILAGHKSAITFVMEFKETGVEDLVGDFGKAYKGLVVYGAKILDERRKALAYAWVKV